MWLRYDASLPFLLSPKKNIFMLSMLQPLRSKNLCIGGDIKYFLPQLVCGEMSLRWMRLVVAIGCGVVSALAGHLCDLGELVSLASS